MNIKLVPLPWSNQVCVPSPPCSIGRQNESSHSDKGQGWVLPEHLSLHGEDEFDEHALREDGEL